MADIENPITGGTSNLYDLSKTISLLDYPGGPLNTELFYNTKTGMYDKKFDYFPNESDEPNVPTPPPPRGSYFNIQFPNPILIPSGNYKKDYNPLTALNFQKGLSLGSLVSNMMQDNVPIYNVPKINLARLKDDETNYEAMRQQAASNILKSQAGARKMFGQASDQLVAGAVSAAQLNEAMNRIGSFKTQRQNEIQNQNVQIANQEAMQQQAALNQERQINLDLQMKNQLRKEQAMNLNLSQIGDIEGKIAKFKYEKELLDKQRQIDEKAADRQERIDIAAVQIQARKILTDSPSYKQSLMKYRNNLIQEATSKYFEEFPNTDAKILDKNYLGSEYLQLSNMQKKYEKEYKEIYENKDFETITKQYQESPELILEDDLSDEEKEHFARLKELDNQQEKINEKQDFMSGINKTLQEIRNRQAEAIDNYQERHDNELYGLPTLQQVMQGVSSTLNDKKEMSNFFKVNFRK